MVYKVNPSIADVSPNIYAAAKQSNLGKLNYSTRPICSYRKIK
jgi:hypothetical protein